jgi:hypothetical protein
MSTLIVGVGERAEHARRHARLVGDLQKVTLASSLA